MQAELIRRIAALEDHLEDLYERLRLADQPAKALYDDTQRELENRFSRHWTELTEAERNTWSTKV